MQQGSNKAVLSEKQQKHQKEKFIKYLKVLQEKNNLNERVFYQKKNLQKGLKLLEQVTKESGSNFGEGPANSYIASLRKSDLIIDLHKALPPALFSQDYFEKNYGHFSFLKDSSISYGGGGSSVHLL